MILAGERVPPQVVHRLAKLLPDEQLASRLVAALDTQTTIFALSESQCETMILALGESPPAPLVALRGALVKQRDLRGRRRETELRRSQRDGQAGATTLRGGR
jgi:hypothetical protein